MDPILIIFFRLASIALGVWFVMKVAGQTGKQKDEIRLLKERVQRLADRWAGDDEEAATLKEEAATLVAQLNGRIDTLIGDVVRLTVEELQKLQAERDERLALIAKIAGAKKRPAKKTDEAA